MWQQIFAFAILAGLIVLFISDRLRYDVVALLGLLAAVLCGIVPADRAFTGFGDDAVIILASALVVSRGVAGSGVAEDLVGRASPYMRGVGAQVAVFAGSVGVMSTILKNIGSLAMMMPLALQTARRTGTSPSQLMMPMSFAALIGGIVTLVGTSPNILVSRMREELLGKPFGMFDFAPVGIVILIAGLAFLTVGWRLLPRRTQGSGGALFEIDDYTTEVLVPEGSDVAGTTVADFEAHTKGEVQVTAIVRHGFRRYAPRREWMLIEGDILVLEGGANAFKRIVESKALELVPAEDIGDDSSSDPVAAIEAVVGEHSILVGRSAEQVRMRERYRVNLLAISRHGRRITQRLRRVRFRLGDVVVLQGVRDTMAETLSSLGCLPLAERNLELGRTRTRYTPGLILLAAIALIVFQVVPVAVAFFGAAIAMVLFGGLALREAYDSIEWPIVILFAALIPVSEAMRTTGVTGLMADGLSVVAHVLPAWAMVGFVIVAAMAVTPFLNNAATVLVMAPIAADMAHNLDLRPDGFLMAVAIGAACDFLTPIGHQCNTLVMGPGGYRFGDYWRLGLPLSMLVVVIGTLMIPVVWPLT
jgi:di/tricarboxylate transporter